MPTRPKKIKYLYIYFVYLFLVWGFYRVFFKFPETIDEFLVKPVVWLLPLFFLLKREKLPAKFLGLTTKNLFKSVYLAIFLGLVFSIEALVMNFVKHGGFDFGSYIGNKTLGYSLLISLATAISEEVSFRGYVYGKFVDYFKSEWLANLASNVLWTLIHVPATFFVFNLRGSMAFTYLLLTAVYGIGSAFIYARTKNISSSILLHILWEWPIVLFR